MIVALLSLTISFFAFSTAKSHFILLNQAYLDAELTADYVTPNIGPQSRQRVSKVPENLMVSGLTPGLTLKNIGNLPLKYKVIDFTIDIDGHYYECIKKTDYTEGIIYPKQQKNFTVSTIKFDVLDKGAQLPYRTLQHLAITGIVLVEYRNLNDTEGVKTWKRTFKWDIKDSVLLVTWTSFDDKI